MDAAVTPDSFLGDIDVREVAWTKSAGSPVALIPQRVLIADGVDALEVAVAVSSGKPRVDDVRRLWSARWNRRAAPVALVVAYSSEGQWLAAMCGTKEDPAVLTDLQLDQIERICAAALTAPDVASAERTLHRLLVGQKDQLVAGVTNVGLFASHELRQGVPQRRDWTAGQERGRQLLLQTVGLLGVPGLAALGVPQDRDDEIVAKARTASG
jgi:hypothetical protein